MNKPESQEESNEENERQEALMRGEFVEQQDKADYGEDY